MSAISASSAKKLSERYRIVDFNEIYERYKRICPFAYYCWQAVQEEPELKGRSLTELWNMLKFDFEEFFIDGLSLIRQVYFVIPGGKYLVIDKDFRKERSK